MAKKMTIDDLAELTVRTMASKEDLQELKGEIHELRGNLNQTNDLVKNMFELVKNIDKNIVEIKQEKVGVFEYSQLEQRVEILEDKMGISVSDKKKKYGHP